MANPSLAWTADTMDTVPRSAVVTRWEPGTVCLCEALIGRWWLEGKPLSSQGVSGWRQMSAQLATENDSRVRVGIPSIFE